MKKPILLLALAACLAAPSSALAQGGPGFLFVNPRVTIGLRAGYAVPRVSSDIFDFTLDSLTVDRSDFNTFHLGGEVALRVADRWDVALSAGWAGSENRSEYRNWVDNNNLPIEQETTFHTVAVSLGAKYFLTDRGRSIGRFAWVPARLTPYVGAGAGVVYYEFEQVGDWVDFQTLDVVFDELRTEGTGPAAYLAAGANLSLGTHVLLTGEARYTLANGPVEGSYAGFDRIDLAGLQLAAGLGFRF